MDLADDDAPTYVYRDAAARWIAHG